MSMKKDIEILLHEINSNEAETAFMRLSGDNTPERLYSLIANGQVLNWLVSEGFLISNS